MVSHSTGAQAPQFDFVDTNGVSGRLSDYAGKKHVVLVLMRGLW